MKISSRLNLAFNMSLEIKGKGAIREGVVWFILSTLALGLYLDHLTRASFKNYCHLKSAPYNNPCDPSTLTSDFKKWGKSHLMPSYLGIWLPLTLLNFGWTYVYSFSSFVIL